MNVHRPLEKLEIHYEEIEHQAIYSVEDATREKIPDRIDGLECKNLFVKSKNHYYLIFMIAKKSASLKAIANEIGDTRLTFCTEEELNSILNLTVGCVSPLGLINDKSHLVTLLIDKELENKVVLMHPNINTKTIAVNLNDFLSLIENMNHSYCFITV